MNGGDAFYSVPSLSVREMIRHGFARSRDGVPIRDGRKADRLGAPLDAKIPAAVAGATGMDRLARACR